MSFEWDRDTYPALGLPEGQRLGLIAQEVEALYPALVSTNAAGFKVIDYGGLTAVLVDALQSQQTTIDRLVGENAALSDRLSQLENGPASDSR